jgi:uncharacterized Zn finger protein
MENIQIVHCPNCGNHAEREYLTTKQIVQTRCASCDYSIAICTESGKVFEYALGASRLVSPRLSASKQWKSSKQVKKLENAWEISPSLPDFSSI